MPCKRDHSAAAQGRRNAAARPSALRRAARRAADTSGDAMIARDHRYPRGLRSAADGWLSTGCCSAATAAVAAPHDAARRKPRTVPLRLRFDGPGNSPAPFRVKETGAAPALDVVFLQFSVRITNGAAIARRYRAGQKGTADRRPRCGMGKAGLPRRTLPRRTAGPRTRSAVHEPRGNRPITTESRHEPAQ